MCIDRLLWKLDTSIRLLEFEFEFAFCVLQNYGSTSQNNEVCVHVCVSLCLPLFLLNHRS